MLAQLAAEMPSLEGAAAHREIVAAWENAAGSPLYPKAEDEFEQAIGFTAFPATAADFLRALVERLKQRVAVAN